MVDEKKAAAKAAPRVDESHTYKVQLKQYVPDYKGSPLVMTQVYHVTGTTLNEWLGMEIVGAYEMDNTVHPDAQAPEKLDEPVSNFIDARTGPKDEAVTVPPRGHPA